MGVQPSNNNCLTPTMIEALLRHERTRKILGKLYRHLDDIISTDKVKLILDCAGGNVRLTRTFHDEN